MQLFAIPRTVAHQALSVHGISQTRILEWVVISFSSRYSAVCLVAQARLTLCDPVDCSPPGSSYLWGFSRQEYWSGLPCPPQGDPPNPGLIPRSPALQADSFPSEPPGKPNRYSTIPYLSIPYVYICLQDEPSVSTYINIVLCDTKHGRCYPCY